LMVIDFALIYCWYLITSWFEKKTNTKKRKRIVNASSDTSCYSFLFLLFSDFSLS
jgi:hypothetical protein